MKTGEDILYPFWLSCIQGVGTKTRERLINYFGSEKAVFQADSEKLYEVNGIRKDVIQKLIDSRNIENISKKWQKMCDAGTNFTYIGAEDYPCLLYTSDAADE